MTILAIAKMYATAAGTEPLAERLRAFAPSASSQPGCRRYSFSVSLTDPDSFLLVSEWDSQQALDAHYASGVFTDFQAGLHGLLARQSELTIYSVDGVFKPVDSGPMDPRDAD